MAGTQQQEAFNQQFGQRYVPLLNPRTSYVGKLLITGLVGVVLVMAVAVGGVTFFDPGQDGATLALLVGSFSSLFLVGALAFVAYITVGDLRELSRKADEVVEGDYTVDFSTGRNDEVGRLYEQFGAVQGQLDDRSNDLESLNKRITGIVQRQRDVIGECGRGDLTLRMDADTGIPQFDALAQAFNGMMRDTETAVAESKGFSQSVAAASNETTASIREVQDQINDVIEATEEISDGVAQQDQRFAQTATEMSNLSATIEEVASSADRLTEQSRETVETTQRGRESAENAVEALDTIRTEAVGAVESVGELEGEMDRIGEVVEFIREIADETNLLAVNAQIEAAHAGEAGEGFGMVADRIKSLADETAQAADDIEGSLTDLQNQTDETTRRIERTSEAVETGTETIEDALTALDDISEVVQQTNASVQEINEATRQQAQTAEDVVRMIDEVANISERTAGQAEDVVEITKQQSASVAQVNRSVENLADQAAQLNDSLSQFSVSQDAVEAGTVGDADLPPGRAD